MASRIAFILYVFLALILIFKELTTIVKCSVFVQRSVLNLLEMLLLPYDLGLSWFSQFCSISEQNRTQSNKIEQNRTIQFDYVRFCSIIELTKSSVFDFVRLPNTIEFNRTIMFDCARLKCCSIFVRLDTRA